MSEKILKITYETDSDCVPCECGAIEVALEQLGFKKVNKPVIRFHQFNHSSIVEMEFTKE